MEKSIKIFDNPSFGRIRTVAIDGEPYFVGKDVAMALEYQNGSRDIKRHVDKEDRTKTMIFDGNQNKETIIINESGLYSLILSSKLPKAKEFKRWVTAEVLPSIRKTGGYGLDNLQEIIGRTVAETVKQLVPLFQNSVTAFDGVDEIVLKKRRKPAGIIEKLPDELRQTVDEMLCNTCYTYYDVVCFLRENGIEISIQSVHRYAKRYIGVI